MKFRPFKTRINYPPLLRKVLAPVHRYFNRNAYYPQQTEYTCGPACLLMVMQQLNPRFRATHEEEMAIWHEANTVYMGDGQPAGCSAHGLAAAALRRGLQADVYDYYSIVPLAGIMPDDEAAIMHKTIETHTQQMRDAGGVCYMTRPSLGLITRILANKSAKIILLVEEFEEGGLHWVVLDKLLPNGQDVVVLDPWCRRRIMREQGQVVPLTILQRLFQLGPQQCGAMVAVYLKP